MENDTMAKWHLLGQKRKIEEGVDSKFERRPAKS